MLAYAGPASHVRFERVSCDCFKDGGALAEVMTLYENIDEDNSEHGSKKNSKIVEDRNHNLAIMVRYLLFTSFSNYTHIGCSHTPREDHVLVD